MRSMENGKLAFRKKSGNTEAGAVFPLEKLTESG
jgi:hypothetical protein